MCSAEVMVMAAEALRRPAVGGVRTACRRLFATDGGEAGRVAREAEAELRAQVAARWNFDFERERPLPGRYRWVPVGGVAKKPSSSKTVVREVAGRRTKAATAKKGAASQHKITEFMRPTKRPAESPSPHKLKMRRLNDELTSTTAPAGST